MKYLLLLLLSFEAFTQPNVLIKGQYEGFPAIKVTIDPNRNHTMIRGIGRKTIDTDADSISTKITDAQGQFEASIQVNRGQLVKTDCLGYGLEFYLKPGDTLIFRNPARSDQPIISGKTAALNHFLIQSGIIHSLKSDSLSGEDKSLHANIINSEFYKTERFAQINENFEAQWQRYQTSCDTTDDATNHFVRASLHGQKYLRKMDFLGSREDKQTARDFHFDLLDDEARLSPMYMQAVRTFIRRDVEHTLREDLIQNKIDVTAYLKRSEAQYEILSHLPKTCEMALFQELQMNVFLLYMFGGNAFDLLFDRFKKYFPQSSHIPYIEDLMAEFKVGH